MKNLLLLFLIVVFIVTSCKKSDDTEYTVGQFGWAVGSQYEEYGTIFHTSNGGSNWLRQGTADNIPATDMSDVSTLNQKEVWVCGGRVDGYGTILNTLDGGETWQRIGNPGQIPNVAFTGISLVNNNVCYVCGDSGIVIKTIDGGIQWEVLTVDTSYRKSFQMISAPDNNNVWAGGIGDTLPVVYHSSDGGNNWVRQGLQDFPTGNIPNAVIDLHAFNSSLVWAVGPGIAFYSMDGGDNWINKSPGSFLHNNGICPISEESAWMATDENIIYKLPQLNTNWVTQHAPQQGVYPAEFMGISAFDDAICWIVTAGYSGKGNILHTKDGGANWVVQQTPYDINLRRVSFSGALR